MNDDAKSLLMLLVRTEPLTPGENQAEAICIALWALKQVTP